jgi:hypothetical protein
LSETPAHASYPSEGWDDLQGTLDIGPCKPDNMSKFAQLDHVGEVGTIYLLLKTLPLSCRRV